jgi:von Willebrand factor type A domain
MNPENKELAREMIKGMEPEYTTHLWDGIQLGLQLFQDNSRDHQGNVRAMMVLTDGKPEGNVGAIPSDGHIPAMRRMGELPAPIHTFGFGYQLQPGLLQSIAEFSGGNYYFIPDSSMLGTVFIHAVANLQSTFARQAVLNITYPSILGLEETGIHINKRKHMSIESWDAMECTINLNTLQYGQSRECYLRCTCRPEVLTNVMADRRPLRTVQATLQYRHGRDSYQENALAGQLGFGFTSLPDSEMPP